MKLASEKMTRIRKIRIFSVIFIITVSFFLVPLNSYFLNFNHKRPIEHTDFIHSSAETVYNQEWLKNNNFATQDNWYYTKGARGDNSTLDANISDDQANFKVLGESGTFELSGIPNSVDSPDWYEFEKSVNNSYLPDNTGIDSDGCWVSHTWNEGANQFPSVHWRKNVSMPVDFSDYTITSASINVIFNATVDDDVDVLGESALNQFGTGDYVRFYVHISDVDYKNSFPVAFNKTSDLGYDGHGLKSSISDKSIEPYDESVLITALESAFEKDSSHSNFTITLGIDIYSEDNWGDDWDTFDELRIKSCNLTFSYLRKIDEFSSISWNQKGNKISGINTQVSEANLKFNYKIDQDWPTALSSFSEIRVLINNNPHTETIRLSSANSTLKEAKIGGFDVTNLILKDVNITLSIQVFIANTFDFDTNITVSIDDVYLNITYTETFADYETSSQLFLESVNKTLDRFIKIPLRDTVNITIKYLDNQTNHISGANVQLSGKVSGQLNESGSLEHYSRIIDSDDLGIGIWLLTVTAQKPNYETQEVQLYIEVIERATEIELLVNDNLTSNNAIIQIEVDKILNLTVFYRDNVTKTFLGGADATLLNIGNFSDDGLQYNYTVNTSYLGLGFNVLSIFFQLDNYSAQSIQIYVEVYDIATDLKLEVDEELTSPPVTIKVDVNELINLTVYYKNNVTQQHISGANVSLNGNNFNETGSQYYYSLNTTTDLGQGITIITIVAQFNHYQTQTIQIYFEVIERDTELEVSIDSIQLNETETIEANVNEILNITVFYRDNSSKTHLQGAAVTVLSGNFSGNFSDIDNQYNYYLNTNDLSQGIAILTLIAYLENYQPQSFQFNIKVSERESEISLYLNSDPQTLNPFYELPFRSVLNITVKYSDNQTKTHINGATVQLKNKTNSEILYIIDEELALNQYTLLLDTSDLEVGGYLFEIVAYANNYKVKTLSLWLTINRIATVINSTSGESYFSISPSESITLSITLMDSDFGGTITNANVTYKWAYGQGALTDSDNDGNFTVKLEDVPTGTYEIIITASGGDDYSFDIYRITLNVVSVTPPDFSLLFISLAGGLVALVIGFTMYEVRFKYPPTVRKSRKVRKKIRKGKKTKPVKDIISREDLIKDHLENNAEIFQLEKKPENGLKEK